MSWAQFHEVAMYAGMAAVMTTGVILPPDWLIMKKVAIPAEIAILATLMKWGLGVYITITFACDA